MVRDSINGGNVAGEDFPCALDNPVTDEVPAAVVEAAAEVIADAAVPMVKVEEVVQAPAMIAVD